MGQEGPGKGLLADLVQGHPRQEVEAVAILPVRGNGEVPRLGGEADGGLQHQALALLEVLAHGVEIRRELHARGEEALALLALALAEELLPPLAHEAEGGLVAAEDLHAAARAVEAVTGGGVAPGGVGEILDLADLPHLLGARQELPHVDAGDGDGQQAHGGEDAVAPTDVIGDHEGLPALPVCQGPEGALVGVRGGEDPLPGALPAVLLHEELPEETEGGGGLRGGAGLGDDVDGEVHVPDQVQDLLQRLGGEAVAGEVDVGGVLFLQVVVGGAQALDDAPGP